MTAMQVRKAGRWLGFSLLLAALVHVATVWLLPQLTMRTVLDRTGEALGFNRIIHLDPAKDSDSLIPRPDPASVESICAFDLSGGPVRLTLTGEDLPVTVSAAGANTVRFFSTSQEADRLVFATEQQAASMMEPVVVAPDDKGLILVRHAAFSAAQRAHVLTVLDRVSCGPA